MGIAAMAQRARGGVWGSLLGCLGLLTILVLALLCAVIVFVYVYTSTPLPL